MRPPSGLLQQLIESLFIITFWWTNVHQRVSRLPKMSKGSKFCSASFVSKVQFFKILSLGWRVRWYEVFIFYIVKSTRWRSQWPVENCLAITKVDKVERGLCESKTAFPSLSSHPVDGLMCGKCIWSLSLPHRGADSKQACL